MSSTTPSADSSAICARHQVVTEPEERYPIRNSRLPSTSDTSRTRRPSRAITAP